MYPIPGYRFPDSVSPLEIRLGTYGTVTLNGVELNTIDSEILAGVQSLSMTIANCPFTGMITLTGFVIKEAIVEGRWVTVEFLPSNGSGVSQEDMEAVSAELEALRWPDYLQMNETHDQLDSHPVILACAAGTFSITPRISFGPALDD